MKKWLIITIVLLGSLSGIAAAKLLPEIQKDMARDLKKISFFQSQISIANADYMEKKAMLNEAEVLDNKYSNGTN